MIFKNENELIWQFEDHIGLEITSSNWRGQKLSNLNFSYLVINIELIFKNWADSEFQQNIVSSQYYTYLICNYDVPTFSKRLLHEPVN